MASDYPTPREELTRKSLDVIAGLLERRDTGAITKGEFQTAIIAVWNCVSGLVDRDILDLVTAATKED